MSTSPLRRAIALLLFTVAALAFTAQDALATHFRYGTISWSTPDPAQPNVIKVRFDATFRWSYPYGSGVASCPGAPFVPGAGVGAGSCPALGASIGANGSLGSILSSVPVKIGAGVTNVTSIPINNFIITSINQTEDWMSGTFEVTLTFPTTVPGTYVLTFQNCCRISTLQNGNNDRDYIVKSTVTIRTPINRPPTSASLPLIKVPHNVAAATFAIPAFDPDGDPLTFSIPPLADSGLFAATPANMMLNATAGVVTWNTIGTVLNALYTAQFKVTDSKGASTVVDVLLTPSTSVGLPPTVYINGTAAPATFNVLRGTPMSFPVAVTAANATPVTLGSSALPVGSSMSPSLPTQGLSGNVSSTFNWTPAPNQVGSYLISYSGLTGSGQQAVQTVNINVTNNPPTITCSANGGTIPASSPTGALFSVTADVDDGDGDSLVYQVFIDGVAQGAATNVAPPASIPFSSMVGLGNHTYQIRVTDNFSPTVNCSGTFSIVDATAPALILPSDAAIFATSPAGASHLFTASASDAIDAAPTVTCAPASGSTFPVGTTAVACTATDASGNSTSGSFSVAVYRPALLTLNAPTAIAGAPVTVTAALVGATDGAPLAGQTVTFDFGGAVAPASAVTDSLGVATVQRTFPTAGAASTTVSFFNPTANYTDRTGTLPPVPETASAMVTVNSAATAFASLTVPSAIQVGELLSVSAVLTRTAAPAGPVSGAVVRFILANAGGDVATHYATTDATGGASVAFPLVTRGLYTVTVSYDGSAALAAASQSANTTALQKTALQLSPVTPTAGAAASVSATLIAIPAGTPIVGETVIFLFDFGMPMASAVTDASGVATVSVTWPFAGSFTASATFHHTAGYFVDPLGVNAPTIVTEPVTVAAAQSSLGLTAPTALFVGDVLTITSTLNRTSAPAGPIAGAPVTYLVTLPSGAVNSLSAITASDGSSSVAMTTHAAGPHSVVARYDGDLGVMPVASSAAIVAVSQTTNVTLNPVNATAGTPANVTATVRQTASGAPVAGATVMFDFGGTIAPATAVTDGNGLATVTVTFPNTGTVPLTASYSGSPASFTLGSSASGIAIVADGTAPVITYAVSGMQGLNGWHTGDATVTWSVTDPESAVSSQTGCDVTIVNTDGSTTLTCTAASAGGTQTVSVIVKRDALAPVLTTDSNQAVSATGVTTIVNFAAATATDATSGVTAVSCTPATGSAFAQGPTTVACTATDEAGNTSQGSFVVTVNDTTAPVFSVLPDITVPGTNPAGETVSWAATADDAVSGNATVTCAPAAGTNFGYGQTPVSCSATDAAGNTATTTFTVTLTDATAPIITPVVTGTMGTNGWYTSDVSVSFDVVDAQSPITNRTGCDAVVVSVDGATQTITCSATSAGGTSSATATFNRDATAPVVTTSPALTVTATSVSGAIVNYAAATATDAASGVSAVSCAPASGTPFPVGPTTVSCSATDQAGNASSATFVVTVSDPTPPVITPTVTGTLGANGWYTSDVTVSFAVTDPESGIASSTGCATTTTATDIVTKTITCSATSAGGTTTKSVTFKRDASAPGITVSPNKADTADSWDGADVTYAPATAVDAVSGIASVVCTPPSGSTFPIGVTTVSCVATNKAGLTTTGAFTVTITDSGEPGKMRGNGEVPAPNNHEIKFDLDVFENRRGNEWGDVDIRVRDTRRRRGQEERFDARTVDDVFFSNAPEYGPGKNSKTGIDTVLFRGTGRWDGQSGYTYVVTASDRGEPGRGRDTFTIEIKSPAGVVVFSGGGTLTEGNIQSSRLQRPSSWWNGHHDNHWNNRGRGRNW